MLMLMQSGCAAGLLATTAMSRLDPPNCLKAVVAACDVLLACLTYVPINGWRKATEEEGTVGYTDTALALDLVRCPSVPITMYAHAIGIRGDSRCRPTIGIRAPLVFRRLVVVAIVVMHGRHITGRRLAASRSGSLMSAWSRTGARVFIRRLRGRPLAASHFGNLSRCLFGCLLGR